MAELLIDLIYQSPEHIMDRMLLWFKLGIFLAVAVSVLIKKQDPVACLGWLLSLALFPFLTTIAYLVGGLNPYESAKSRKRRSAFLIREKKPPFDRIAAIAANEKLLEESDVNSFHNVSNWLTGISSEPIYGGCQFKIMEGATEAYKAFEEEIRNAKKTVFIQFYQFQADVVGKYFLDLLVEKAKEGVKINILYDAIGSFKLTPGILKNYRQKGLNLVNFMALHPVKRRFQINWRNHRKIILIDNKVAFTGGLNIAEMYLDGPNKDRPQWHDVHYEVKGPILRFIHDVFAEDWHFATGEPLVYAEAEHEPLKNGSSCLAQGLSSGPSNDRATYHATLLSVVHAATKRLWFSTGYFVPDQSLLRALRQAAARGVDVKIVIPYKSNHPIPDYCATSYFGSLLRFGIELYRYRHGMNHAKILLADDDLVLTGSSNLDYRSFFLNFDMDFVVRSEEFAQSIAAILAKSFARSQLLTKGEIPGQNILSALPRRIARLFAPLL